MAINIGTAVAFLDLNTTGFSKGFKSAFADLAVFKDKTATTETKLKGLSSTMNTVGKGLTLGVTAPLVGVGAASVRVAATFEQGMSKVQAISGATGKDFDALNKKAIEMGAKTKYSATESAEAFQYMAMAGWNTADMLDGIEGVMNLAAASGEDLATTSDIVTDALTAFGLSAKDSTHFADVLAKTSAKSNTNVAMLGETFKYVAPVAGALGYSVEDCSVAIGLMANSGIKASQAGTALRSTFTRLAKPTKQVQKAMDEYNISMTDANGNMKPLNNLLVELRGKFSGLTESQKTQLAATLAGTEGMSGLLAIVNASEEDFQNLTNEIADCDGASQDMADTMNDNLLGAFTLFKSALESAGIAIGQRLTPYIRKATEWVQKWVEKFNNLSDEEKDQIVKIGLLVAAIGPFLLIVSRLINFGLKLHKTFQNISMIIKNVQLVIEGFGSGAIAPIMGIVAVIAILVAAFVHLWQTSEDFRNAIKDDLQQIKDKFDEVKEHIQQKMDELGIKVEDIVNFVTTLWNQMCDMLAPAFIGAFDLVADTLSQFADSFMDFSDIITDIVQGDWSGLKDDIIGYFTDITDNFTTFTADMLSMGGGLVSQLLENFGFDEASKKVQEFTDTASDSVKNLPQTFDEVDKKIAEFCTNVKDNVTELKDNFVEFFTETIPNKAEEAKNKLNEFADNVKTFFTETIPEKIDEFKETIKNKLNEIKDTIVEFLTVTVPEKVEEFITVTLPQKMQELVDWLGNFLFTQLPYLIGQLAGYIWIGLTNLWDTLKTYIPIILEWCFVFVTTTIPTKIAEVFLLIVDKVVEFLTVTLPQKITEFFDYLQTLPSKIQEHLTDTFNKVVQWGTETVENAKQTARDFVDKFIEKVKELPTKVKDKLNEVKEKIKTWATETKQKAKDTAREFVDNFITKLTELPSKVWNEITKIPEKILQIKAQMKTAGKDIITALWDGIKEIGNKVTDWVSNFADNIKSFVSNIVKGFKDVTSNANEAKTAARSVNGSHANGLDYVPFNGYIAELHEGERVLTKQQNREYNEGTTSGGDTFVFYNTKPDPYTYSKQMKKAKKELLYGI